MTSQCPEGQSWKDVPMGAEQEVLNISMGPTGLLWVVTWSGTILVRIGVSWFNPIGKMFCHVIVEAHSICGRNYSEDWYYTPVIQLLLMPI